MKEQLWTNVLAVREQSPLVHSITNYVVMNNTANALLAAGASPIMAHAHPEMQDMVSIVGALVVNIGTLDEYWVESMKRAVTKAEEVGTPWVLDPVGAGATPYRNNVVNLLTTQFKPTVIRGNASEIMSVARVSVQTKGVDSTHESNEALDAATSLANTLDSVVCISGATDLIVSKERLLALENGHPMMARVTGMGCTATALIGAFCALPKVTPFEATASAMALMGVAGELAAEKATGPGSFQVHFLDALYAVTKEQFMERLHVKQHEAAL
ncbi:hydroxyethylthiazole kinase [Telluribacter humicola]|uniref:hydroxyethylthiazole kinase n=1 Tax=Telluribacter humicola TaxID=1720261 RepID=UPI001A96E2C9|nr:hydroxyethylthiazole kinase [Telluribacter humicola]